MAPKKRASGYYKVGARKRENGYDKPTGWDPRTAAEALAARRVALRVACVSFSLKQEMLVATGRRANFVIANVVTEKFEDVVLRTGDPWYYARVILFERVSASDSLHP